MECLLSISILLCSTASVLILKLIFLFQMGLRTIIIITLDHTHSLKTAAALGYLHPTKETVAKFLDYFNMGMSFK